eukprot:scaffold64416_cov69-Phaeocystis_antarctica.AAC.2
MQWRLAAVNMVFAAALDDALAPRLRRVGSIYFAWMMLPAIVLSCYRVMVIDRFSKKERELHRVAQSWIRKSQNAKLSPPAPHWQLGTGDGHR